MQCTKALLVYPELSYVLGCYNDLARASRAHNEEKRLSKNQIVAKELMPSTRTSKSDPKHANEIRLKSTCLLASKYDISITK
jgi:hypothetical protein